MMKKRYRKGVGAFIFSANRNILLCERRDKKEIFQLPQGGIEENESTHKCLQRELEEETGLKEKDYIIIKEYPLWMKYDFIKPKKYEQEIEYHGQIHKWFYILCYTKKIEYIDKQMSEEFTSYRWQKYHYIQKNTKDIKYEVYRKLVIFYEKKILPHSRIFSIRDNSGCSEVTSTSIELSK